VAAVSPIIRVACTPGQARVAVTGPDGLLDYALWRPGAPDQAGALYRGRIARYMPSLEAWFVTLPGGRSGLLPARDVPAKLNDGTVVFVRIARAPQGGKGARLALADAVAEGIEASLQGDPALLRSAPSPVERFAAYFAGSAIHIDDAYVASLLPPSLHARVIRVQDAFDADTHSQTDALMSAEIALTRAISASITPTPALVAIDMDMHGHDTAPKQTAQFAANRDALPALCDQIRMRALGGAILIDVAGLQVRKRHALLPELQAALRADPAGTRCLGITQLGLFEIVRPRTGTPLHEQLSSAHGRLLTMLADLARTVTTRLAPRVAVGTSILAAWDEDGFAREAFFRMTGHTLSPALSPSLPPLSWRVESSDGPAR